MQFMAKQQQHKSNSTHSGNAFSHSVGEQCIQCISVKCEISVKMHKSKYVDPSGSGILSSLRDQASDEV